MDRVRIDRWTWATRIFKTRMIAAEACKRGCIVIGGVAIKPSRMIKTSDVVQVRKSSVTFSFKAIGLVESHVGAKLVPNYLKNVTAPDQYKILRMDRISGFVNCTKDFGCPTKKDRRESEQLTKPELTDDGFDFEFDFGEEDEE